MTYFEYGYDLDAQQAKDNEQYENNRKVIRVIDDDNTPPLDVHKVTKGKSVKELIKSKNVFQKLAFRMLDRMVISECQ